MNIQISNYLMKVKPILKELLEKLLNEYDYASILAADSTGKSYSVSKSGTNITSDIFTCERGFVVRVYDQQSYCEHSFSFITKDDIPTIMETIKNELQPINSHLSNALHTIRYDQLEENEVTFSKTSELEVDPKDFGDEQIIHRLRAIYEAGIQQDNRIINFSARYEYTHISKIFLSKKKDLEQSILWSCGGVSAFAQKGDQTKHHGDSFSGLCGVELIDRMEGKTNDIVKVALELLECKPLPPGEYDVICSSDVTGLIAHEAFGHGVEMDMFVKKRALADQYIGKYVASPLVTMHDGASIGDNTGSYFFDDEGMLAQDTVIIDQGILKKGLNDAFTALTLGVDPTGNGRREGFSHKAYSRMTNTFFTPGTSTLEEMISSISYGFLLDDSMSGMEDPKNWGIQCMVNFAREIKDGKLTGTIYSPIILTGYVPDLLKSISMVSNDMTLTGTGACGKGYKEWVKVSTGGPAIKARVRLG